MPTTLRRTVKYSPLSLRFDSIADLIMSDDWDAADETAPAVEVAAADLPEIQLFGKWSCEEVNVSDMSLQVRSSFCVKSSKLNDTVPPVKKGA